MKNCIIKEIDQEIARARPASLVRLIWQGVKLIYKEVQLLKKECEQLREYMNTQDETEQHR
jgi:hypothetical protein